MSVYAADTSADARNRAWRTFAQGLLFDVATVVVAALVTVMSDVQWTQTYWIGVASLVGKSVITAAISYAARKLVPPAR